MQNGKKNLHDLWKRDVFFFIFGLIIGIFVTLSYLKFMMVIP